MATFRFLSRNEVKGMQRATILQEIVDENQQFVHAFPQLYEGPKALD